MLVEKNIVNAPEKDSSMLSWKNKMFGSFVRNRSRYSCNNDILISSGGVGGKSKSATSSGTAIQSCFDSGPGSTLQENQIFMTPYL